MDSHPQDDLVSVHMKMKLKLVYQTVTVRCLNGRRCRWLGAGGGMRALAAIDCWPAVNGVLPSSLVPRLPSERHTGRVSLFPGHWKAIRFRHAHYTLSHSPPPASTLHLKPDAFPAVTQSHAERSPVPVSTTPKRFTIIKTKFTSLASLVCALSPS